MQAVCRNHLLSGFHRWSHQCQVLSSPLLPLSCHPRLTSYRMLWSPSDNRLQRPDVWTLPLSDNAHALSVSHSPRIPYIQICRCSSLRSRSPLYRSHVQNQNLTHGSGGLTVPYPQNCWRNSSLRAHFPAHSGSHILTCSLLRSYHPLNLQMRSPARSSRTLLHDGLCWSSLHGRSVRMYRCF